ncbi:MAG TPA: HAD-IB family hydrolase [Polyangiales bacterium]|nr:HAD-IB family hydrolase [Polyangiales bacterium]
MKVAAFFDLDRTLIRENSGKLYAYNEYRAGRMSAWQLAKSAYWLALHHYALLDVESAYGKAAMHWRGVPGSEVASLAKQWFARDVHERLTPGGRRALDEHRNDGHMLVLLSNTSQYIAAAASESWQLDAWLANAIPCDAQGRILGTMGSPLCIGPGKVHKAEAFAMEHEIDLAQSYFYGDSITDAPMLERVGHPRIVNPDPGLAKIARERGWPVVSF